MLFDAEACQREGIDIVFHLAFASPSRNEARGFDLCEERLSLLFGLDQRVAGLSSCFIH
jgi:hypothetical protein